MKKLAFVVALLIAFPSAARANVTEENFVLDTTRDLVALCGVDAADPNAMSAIHMCHGYFTGIVHFHQTDGRSAGGPCVLHEGQGGANSESGRRHAGRMVESASRA